MNVISLTSTQELLEAHKVLNKMATRSLRLVMDSDRKGLMRTILQETVQRLTDIEQELYRRQVELPRGGVSPFYVHMDLIDQINDQQTATN